MKRVCLLALMLSLTWGAAVGQQVTVDLKKIDPQLAAEILTAQKKDTFAPQNVANQAKEWAGIGTAVGEAIGATAKSLSVEVNDFVKTPVGQWAFFFLFWYVIGHKLWSIIAGITIWAVLGCTLWRSFTIFHRPKEVLDGNGEVRLVQYEFETGDARSVSAVFHVAAFLVLSAVMMIVIL